MLIRGTYSKVLVNYHYTLAKITHVGIAKLIISNLFINKIRTIPINCLL